MRFAALCLGVMMLGGCVSISPRAQKIQLLPATSNKLAHCTKLGAIDAEASAMGQINAGDLDRQAANNLRDAAAAQWGNDVDSVVLLTIDHVTTKATAHGVGYRCAAK